MTLLEAAFGFFIGSIIFAAIIIIPCKVWDWRARRRYEKYIKERDGNGEKN